MPKYFNLIFFLTLIQINFHSTNFCSAQTFDKTFDGRKLKINTTVTLPNKKLIDFAKNCETLKIYKKK